MQALLFSHHGIGTARWLFGRRYRQLYFVIRDPDFNGPICGAFCPEWIAPQFAS
jgi:hypothetical protein